MLKTFFILAVIILTPTLVMAAPMEPPRPVLPAQEGAFTVTFDDLEYADFMLEGLHPTTSIWIPMKPDWSTVNTQVQLRLNYIASPMVIEAGASLTLYAEGIPVTSVVPIPDGSAHTLTVDIPTDHLTSNLGFELRIRGVLPITEQECTALDSPSQWLRILRSSQISYTPGVEGQIPNLDRVAYALAPQDIIPTIRTPVNFILPDNPDALHMKVASQIAARLGNELAGRLAIHTYYASEIDPENLPEGNLVLIGTPATLPLITTFADQLPLPIIEGTYTDNEPVSDELGVIQLFTAVDKTVLLVSGEGEVALDLAGQSFIHTPTFRTFYGQVFLVSDLVEANEIDLELPWTKSVTSFGQLNFGERTVRGVGTYQEYFTFLRPPGWDFISPAFLRLDVIASPALSEQSYLSVFLNEVPVGSITIGDESRQRISFSMPIPEINRLPNGERPLEMTLRIEVSHHMEQNIDQCPNEEAAWTRISTSSEFDMAHDYVSLPDLQAFPYPFVSEDVEILTTIIVPSNPDHDELNMAFSLVSLLGHYAATDPNIRVLTTDRVQEAYKASDNMIILGTTENQPLLTEVLTKSVDEFARVRFAVPDTGYLEVLPSPYRENRSIMLIYAETEEKLADTLNALLQETPPVIASGSLALIKEDNKISLYDPLVDTALPTLEPDIVIEADQSDIETENVGEGIAPQVTPGTSGAQNLLPTAPPIPESAIETTEDSPDEGDSPVSSTIVFVVIIILAILLIPTAFMLSRQPGNRPT